MRDIAVIGFAQVPVERCTSQSDVELVQAVVSGALKRSGLDRRAIDFWCSGSADMLVGRPFSFVNAIDAIGAWPPISESHVEMDGAWALYESWVRLQHGDFHTALVYCFGQESTGDLRKVLTTQLDPYYSAPLWPDSVSLAALQARALLDSGRYTEEDFARVAYERRMAANDNPNALIKGSRSPEELLQEPYIQTPLRRHACPPLGDGACAIVIATKDYLDREGHRPAAWIRGMDHRIDEHELGARDLTRCPSARIAADAAGYRDVKIDRADLHAPFAHQELILRDELELGDEVAINPQGGPLAANPMIVAGLTRIGEAAEAVMQGSSKAALAHASSGPALQQNLVCVLEGRHG